MVRKRVILMNFIEKKKKKTNHIFIIDRPTRGIMPKPVKSGEDHFCGLSSGQHSSEKTSQRWRVIGDTVLDLTRPGIEPLTSRTDSDVFNYFDNQLVHVFLFSNAIILHRHTNNCMLSGPGED